MEKGLGKGHPIVPEYFNTIHFFFEKYSPRCQFYLYSIQ